MKLNASAPKQIDRVAGAPSEVEARSSNSKPKPNDDDADDAWWPDGRV